MRLGVRRKDVEVPHIRWRGDTCLKCGERIWVPYGLEGKAECIDHNLDTQPAAGSLEFIAKKQSELLKGIIQQ